jgi:tRNA A58 N-methylase Trm61
MNQLVLTWNDREDSYLVCASRSTELTGTSHSVIRQDVKSEHRKRACKIDAGNVFLCLSPYKFCSLQGMQRAYSHLKVLC